MKTNIKIKFKDNTELVFDANTYAFKNDGFCELYFDEENKSRLVASVSMDEIKYLIFVEVEDE